MTTPPSRRFLPSAASAVLLLGLTGGCHHGPSVQVTTADGARRLDQPFDRVYARQDADGGYELVLSYQGIDRDNLPGPGEILTPQEKIPVRQVMALKVNWRPKRGFQYDHPAGANASVRWVLLGASPDPKVVDYIEFAGTALVKIWREDAGTFGVQISNGYLEPVLTRGQIVSSMGPSTFEGRFTAKENPRAVIDTLAGLPPAPPPRAVAAPLLTPLPLPAPPAPPPAATRPAR